MICLLLQVMTSYQGNEQGNVFNISKSIWILRNIKELENFKKAQESDLFTIASDDVIRGKRTREQAIGVLSETLHNIIGITT